MKVVFLKWHQGVVLETAFAGFFQFADEENDENRSQADADEDGEREDVHG